MVGFSRGRTGGGGGLILTRINEERLLGRTLNRDWGLFKDMISSLQVLKSDIHSRISLATSEIFVNENYKNKSHPKFLHLNSKIVVKGH